MLTKGKKGGYRKGLGFSSGNTQLPTHMKGPKNTFTKGKSKANVFLQTMMYGRRHSSFKNKTLTIIKEERKYLAYY